MELALCGNCGAATLTCNGKRALLCDRGESVRGHNAIRDELHSMSASVDTAAETGPEGLIASRPHLRPADVLTGAFHNGHLAAVDVGVISPSAAGAGLDCVVTMAQRKLERMQPFADELEAFGIQYQPFAISCWGRMHPAALQMLGRLARRMARREGGSSHRAVLQRLVARITILVMRRAARMVLRWLPQIAGSDDEGPTVEAPLGSHATWRAGDPSTTGLQPFPMTPPSGTCAMG